MKNILACILLALATTAMAAPEEKVVCVNKIGKDGKVVNGKDGKPVQECKKIKVHKKLDVKETKSK
jgi:hypothetical protein